MCVSPVRGESDQTIPYALGEMLFQAANEPKLFVSIANADHNDWLTDEYVRRRDEFIKRTAIVDK